MTTTTLGHFGIVSSQTHLFPYYYYSSRAIGGGTDLVSFINDISNAGIHLTIHVGGNYTETYAILNSGQSSIPSPHTSPQPVGTYYIRATSDSSGSNTEFGFVVHPVTTNYIDNAGETSSAALNLGTVTDSINHSDSFFTLFRRVLDKDAHTYTVNFSDPEIPIDQQDFYKFRIASEGDVTFNFSGSYGSALLYRTAQGPIDANAYISIISGQSIHLIAGEYTFDVLDSVTTSSGSGQNVVITRNAQWEDYEQYNFSISFRSGGGGGGTSRPDLVADTVQVGNTSIAAGGSTTVSYHLYNGGAATSPSPTAGIYLSADNIITTLDTLLIVDAFTNTLDPAHFFDTANDPTVVTIPDNLTAGTYYIGVVADHDGLITESNETNNASTAVAISVVAKPSIAINDVNISEGDSGTRSAIFTVTRSGSTAAAFDVNYGTANGSATVADGDFVSTSGTLHFNSGVTTMTIPVTINGDTKFEANETFLLLLGSANNGVTVSRDTGTGTIINDDLPPPSVTINDVSITEGNSGTKVATFTVSRTGDSRAFDVNYGTAPGSATASDSDYVATTGTVHFGAGVNSQTISVTINGDAKYESNESFFVLLGGATNGATIGDDTGLGLIVNDDPPPPSVSINDVAIVEGDSGTKTAIFTVSRTGDTIPFDVNFGTAPGTASAGDADYVPTSGTLRFGAGVNAMTIPVTINGDTKVESSESFFVLLGGATNGATIADDTGIGIISNDDVSGSVSINDVAIVEGTTGTKTATFTVTRSGGTAPFDVNYGTTNGTATTTDGDYLGNVGTLHFGAGVNTQTVSVTINGDLKVETSESFFVLLGGATNSAGIGDDTGVGIIVNDDIHTLVNDFNADSRTDLLWRSDAGNVVTWNLNDARVLATNVLGSSPTNWKIAGTGDFNGDSKADILWRSDAGTLVSWDMTDNRVLSTNSLGSVPANWKIAGIGDFNGDAKADILWRSDGGTIVTWDMDDNRTLSTNNLGSAPADWKIAATGDFNGDGKTDLLWRSDSGNLVTWNMNDAQVLSTNSLGSAPGNWKIAATGDFNGDNKTDLLWRSDAGNLVTWDMNDNRTLSTNSLGSAPADWKIATTGDFNGDGKTDLLWRSDAGNLVTWNMNDAQVIATNFLGVAPADWHII